MGTVTVTGALVIIVGWLSLVEYDQFSEAEKEKIIQKIKSSPAYIGLIASMPLGIIINMIGTLLGLVWLIVFGASVIFLQAIIVSLIFLKWKRWKGIFMLVAVVVLGVFIYVPLFF